MWRRLSFFNQTDTYLLWEDLSKAEGTEYSFPVQYSNGSIVSVQVQSPLESPAYHLSQNPSVPIVSGGALWPDPVNKIFYLYGGEHSDPKQKTGQGDFTLWYYDTIYNRWDSPSADGSKLRISWPTLGASAVSDQGIAYYYGGYLTNASDLDTSGQPVMQSALISYNMDSRVWVNDTGSTTPRAEGSMHHLPASDRGMLVYFGGVEGNSSGVDPAYVSTPSVARAWHIANKLR
jgi:hypothetical protein